MVVEMGRELLEVVEHQHIKPGKGPAFVRIKLKNWMDQSIIEKTLRPEEKFLLVRIRKNPGQFLYKSGTNYSFMDTVTYEQIDLHQKQLGHVIDYMKESEVVTLMIREDTNEVIGVELPSAVELRIIQTEPGLRGNTVSGTTKYATLETGARINIPLFIEQDEVIKVDTRSGAYLERAR